MLPKYKKEIIKREDGMYQLVHPKDFGEKLKRHAFFYFSALRYTSELYLDYIIKSVKEVM